jgi:DNA-binding MarR family transcriptional regulator
MKKDTSLELLNAADELGFEARTATGDHAALKLWLRMLSCTNQIEAEIRRRLRVQFDTSLPRLKELSSHLMVTGANVTGITDELERDGLVARFSSPTDRRSWIVRLTPKGRSHFETMAQAHEQWILELFACLGAPALSQLYQQLGSLRVHVLDKQSSAIASASSDPFAKP